MIKTADQIRRAVGVHTRQTTPAKVAPAAPHTITVTHVVAAVSAHRHVFEAFGGAGFGTTCVHCWGWCDDWRHLATDANGNPCANVGG